MDLDPLLLSRLQFAFTITFHIIFPTFTIGLSAYIATLCVMFATWRWLETGHEVLPFLATIALFLLGYLGLLISNFPYLVPPSLTIWQTAAAPATHVFMLMGTLVMLPIILGYTIFVYWIFGGKLREGEGYH
jgi:cytochrome d ubiquinol oxidase subunit II